MSHCVHFGVCGGCAVDDRASIDKAGLVAAALRRAGFVAPVLAALVETPLRTRRRVDLAAVRDGGAVRLGLHRARSHEIVDMMECVLLAPRLFALVAPLRAVLRHLQGLRRAGSVLVNMLDGGADVLLRLDAALSGPDRVKLIAFAQGHGVVRVSAAVGAGEVALVAMLAPAVVTFAEVAVAVAPGAFLQASLAGEAAIVGAVLEGLAAMPARARVAELYAGVGTLSFALAGVCRVEGYEGAAEAVAAQDRAIRLGGLAGRMRVVVRDLVRQPVKVSEFAGCAAVVLDPPYGGAGPQMRNLAASGVGRIVYVSCNPVALAADAAVLREAGYQVVVATPIDQFPFSGNVESVVVFAGA